MLLGRLGLVVVDQSSLCETRASRISPRETELPGSIWGAELSPKAYSLASSMCEGATMGLGGPRTIEDLSSCRTQQLGRLTRCGNSTVHKVCMSSSTKGKQL